MESISVALLVIGVLLVLGTRFGYAPVSRILRSSFAATGQGTQRQLADTAKRIDYRTFGDAAPGSQCVPVEKLEVASVEHPVRVDRSNPIDTPLPRTYARGIYPQIANELSLERGGGDSIVGHVTMDDDGVDTGCESSSPSSSDLHAEPPPRQWNVAASRYGRRSVALNDPYDMPGSEDSTFLFPMSG